LHRRRLGLLRVNRDWVEPTANPAMSAMPPKAEVAWANIPPKRNRKEPMCFGPRLYRARNLVERFFNKIKQCRRIDKLAADYLAFIKLAAIESTP
jgi:transposase